jgi:diaminopimelate decarboxylase
MNTPTSAPEKHARQPWVKPSLIVHRTGLVNKFGAARRETWSEELFGVPVARLIGDHGSPLFVFSESRLRENIKHLQQAFEARYPRVQYAWSYKTNYLAAICNVFHQEGAWAEVVSAFEYDKARASGVPGKQILFNGPHKTRAALERAVHEEAHIHVDHLDELYLLEEIAGALERPVNISIRLNFETGYTENWGRFGFNIESGQAMDAAWRIAGSDCLTLTGLHSHIGTFILDQRAYSAQARIMAAFMNEAEERTGCEIETIDVGGGFASRNALQGIYLPPEQVVPSIEQYAEAICTPLLEATYERAARGRRPPLLLLETGRATVDDAGALVTTVFGNKKLPDGRRAVILDAGVNLLFTAFWYNHNVQPTRELMGAPEETVLYGPLCMNIDVMRQSVLLPPLDTGDTLIMSPVGAYNNTQWLQFIEYRPNVVMVHPDGNVSVIREAENLERVTALERIPPHLRLAEQPQAAGRESQ